jgi:DNA ligase (NAD+)
LRQASREELQNIFGIGEVVADSIVDWQKNKNEQDLLDRLLTYIELIPELGIALSGPLLGKSLIFTGTLDGISRFKARETKDVAIVHPAEGPSLGVAPSGT